jgi:HEAT repeat protein
VLSLNFETIIYLAWRIGIGSIILTALLFFVIIGIRRYFDRKIKRAAEFREIWEAILLASLERIPNDLPPIEEKDQLTFLILWNYFQELLLEESKKNLMLLAQKVDLFLIARRALRRRNIKSRLLAVNTLGWLKDKESWNLLKKMLHHPDTTFSLSVAAALIRINPRKSTWLILPLIAKRNDWSIERSAELAKQIGMEEIADKLILQINRTPRHQLPKMIRLLDLLLPSQSNPIIRRLLTKYDDKEIIYACLLVYKDVDNLQRVRFFLTHEDWEIRMQAATCLGKYGSEEDIDYLISTTEDPEWWVRYRSAQALARIPEMSLEYLKTIAKHHSNQFSHDVILRIVTEREVAESCGLSY